jgi:hypothetical protein
MVGFRFVLRQSLMGEVTPSLHQTRFYTIPDLKDTDSTEATERSLSIRAAVIAMVMGSLRLARWNAE